MNTPDKCPHCGAEIEYFAGIDAYWSTCGSTAKKQSDLCKERSAHAATRKELEKAESRVRELEGLVLDNQATVFSEWSARIYLPAGSNPRKRTLGEAMPRKEEK